MKKILVHAYSNLNLGDDLFLKILRDRYPHQTFYLLDGNNFGVYSTFRSFAKQTTLERLVGRAVRLFFPKQIETYNSFIERQRIQRVSKFFDCYLLLGGSMFIQNQKGLTSNDVFKIEAIKNFNHSFVIGANFGPYIEDDYINQYRNILHFCDGVSFRDSYSHSLFNELKNTSHNPDLVFQLQFDKSKKIPNSVGISLINLSSRSYLKHQADSYFDFILDAIKILLKEGKKVYLFSFCKREGDEIAIKKITNVIQSKSLNIHCYEGNIKSFLETYCSMEAALCTRFHSMILSLVFNQKMLPLIYSKKMTQVLEDIGYTDYYIDILKINKYDVKDSLHKLYNSEYVLPDSIRKESESMFSLLDNYLLS